MIDAGDIPSLGHKLYIEALMLFDAVVGNSSSGIIEAPLCGIPSINIGDRQKGRLRFGDVIDVDNCEMNILKELQKIESGCIARAGQINFSQTSPYTTDTRVFIVEGMIILLLLIGVARNQSIKSLILDTCFVRQCPIR